jgi:EAL domain-containing protein (putative c-di-GMP-specific phosphodiesterase class I)
MTDEQTPILPKRRTRDVVRNGIVIVSMTFVALAIGFGLHLQMGFAFWPSAAAATAVYIAMLFSHLMLSQNRETSLLHRELVRLSIELAELRRTPAEGGILREAPSSGGSGNGSGQAYGYPRGYQPEVTVQLASSAGPVSKGPSQQIEMQPRPAAVDPRSARATSNAPPNMDDAADLLSDLGAAVDVAATVVPSAPLPTRTRQPVMPPLSPLVQAPVQVQPLPAETDVSTPIVAPVSTVKPQPTPVTAASLAEAIPTARMASAPESQPTPAKRTTPTEGDRDVEAIHDLIKKLAADIVGGQAPAPAPVSRNTSTILVPDRVPEKLAEKPLAAAMSKPAAPAVTSTAKGVSTGRVPMAAAKPVTQSPGKRSAHPEAADQALADQLDMQPPVRMPDRGPDARTTVGAPASPVAAAAVAAARTAVEARMAGKAGPLPTSALDAAMASRIEPSVVVTPAVATVPQNEMHSQHQVGKAAVDIIDNDDSDLAQIGAQLAADLGPERTNEPELEVNLQALKSAVDAMRAQPTVAALAAALDPVDDGALDFTETAASNPVLREKLALISNALDEDQFDVCLEAIIGLDDRRAQHYEVTVRLKDIDDDIWQIAHGSGLLPLLDAAVVDQAARIAWKLEDRGRPGSLFSQITGESLESDRFLNRFADTYRHSETVAARLVLAFTQNDLRNFSAAHWVTLRDMADLGFRFSLEDLTDLDLDFEALKDAGFGFVKLDASVFLDGLPMATGRVPASHICSYFEDAGLVVIVGRIAEEAEYELLLESGVGLGQGLLFGIARPVKADVLKSPQRAVA